MMTLSRDPYGAYSDEVERETESLKMDMQGGSANLLVAVRIRPPLRKESSRRQCVKTVDNKMVIVLDHETSEDPYILDENRRAERSREKRYAFDYVFDHTATQQDVFRKSVMFLLDGILEGFAGSVFAYGSTGSGKTYTMSGDNDQPGIIYLTLEELFRRIKRQETQKRLRFKVAVSYLEVYNENIRDLLTQSSDYLDLREDPIRGTIKVAGLTEIEATNAEDVLESVRKGNRRRTCEATGANEASSRSHAVLQIVVEQRDKAPDTVEELKIGKLSMIDLAGSERASKTNNRGIRMVEGANINRSLLALGNCINCLGNPKQKGTYVPYRDSKLTRLLKDSISGNCRTVMVAAISPVDFEESLNTLKYANRAKNIKTSVARNVVSVSYHVHQYMQIIADLRSEVSFLKNELSTVKKDPEDAVGEAGAGGTGGDGDGDRGTDSHVDLMGSFRGAPEEMHSADDLRAKVRSNFEERVNLRKAVADLEEQNVQNANDVRTMQLQLLRYESKMSTETDPESHSEASRSANAMRRDMRTISGNLLKNREIKQQLFKRIETLEKEAVELQKSIGAIVKSKNMRAILEMDYRNRLLELQNLELEQAAAMHARMNQTRRTDMDRLIAQLRLRDGIILRLTALLNERGISLPEDFGDEYITLSELERTVATTSPKTAGNTTDLFDLYGHQQQQQHQQYGHHHRNHHHGHGHGHALHSHSHHSEASHNSPRQQQPYGLSNDSTISSTTGSPVLSSASAVVVASSAAAAAAAAETTVRAGADAAASTNRAEPGSVSIDRPGGTTSGSGSSRDSLARNATRFQNLSLLHRHQQPRYGSRSYHVQRQQHQQHRYRQAPPTSILVAASHSVDNSPAAPDLAPTRSPPPVKLPELDLSRSRPGAGHHNHSGRPGRTSGYPQQQKPQQQQHSSEQPQQPDFESVHQSSSERSALRPNNGSDLNVGAVGNGYALSAASGGSGAGCPAKSQDALTAAAAAAAASGVGHVSARDSRAGYAGSLRGFANGSGAQMNVRSSYDALTYRRRLLQLQLQYQQQGGVVGVGDGGLAGVGSHGAGVSGARPIDDSYLSSHARRRQMLTGLSASVNHPQRAGVPPSSVSAAASASPPTVLSPASQRKAAWKAAAVSSANVSRPSDAK